jgi:RNA polymerase sigma-70 factor, ECF subfamily
LKPKPSTLSSKAKPWNQAQWESWAKLMVRVQQGELAAYDQLLNELGPVLLGYVRKRVFNPDIVQDVYQEVLLTFHKARHSYEPSRPFGPWLFTVARNSMLDALAKNRRFVEREIAVEELPETGTVEMDGSLGDELDQALKALPAFNREAIELLKLRGLSLEEAAAELKITVSALKVRAHRGYRQLRELLKGKPDARRNP